MPSDKAILTRDKCNKIKDAVLDCEKRCGIVSLPVDLYAIMTELNIMCIPRNAADELSIDLPSQREVFTLARKVGNSATEYLIVYDSDMMRQRLRWEIAHELGHIVLGHLDCCKFDVDVSDAEANYFVQELLTPLSVLDRLGARDAKAVSEVCGISSQAAAIRVKAFDRRDSFVKKYGNTKHDERFIAQFFDTDNRQS